MRDAYIVSAVRTPGCKKGKGAFNRTRPENLLSHILNAATEKIGGFDKKIVDDIMIGCAIPEAEQGLNMAEDRAPHGGIPGQRERRHGEQVLLLGP